jgi:hypothetical protein
MPKKISLPIPLDRWFKDVKRVEELRKILESETFREAAATLKESAGPSFGSIATDSGTNGNRFAWFAGYRDAFNDLQKLTKLKDTTNSNPIIEEWMHIQTPQQ